MNGSYAIQTKWADYVITGVRYDYTGSAISAVEVRSDNGQALGGAWLMTREQMVTAITIGQTAVTAFKRGDQWFRGEDVHVVPIGGERYLRTDANSIRADNLGALPQA